MLGCSTERDWLPSVCAAQKAQLSSSCFPVCSTSIFMYTCQYSFVRVSLRCLCIIGLSQSSLTSSARMLKKTHTLCFGTCFDILERALCDWSIDCNNSCTHMLHMWINTGCTCWTHVKKFAYVCICVWMGGVCAHLNSRYIHAICILICRRGLESFHRN